MDLKCPSTGALKLANHRKPIWSTLFTKAVSFSRGAEVPLFPMFWKVLTEVYALETWWLDGFLVFSRSNLFLTGSKPVWGASSVSKTIAYKRSPPKRVWNQFGTALKRVWNEAQEATSIHLSFWNLKFRLLEEQPFRNPLWHSFLFFRKGKEEWFETCLNRVWNREFYGIHTLVHFTISLTIGFNFCT